jgi:uncharacterized membrane protein
MVSNQEKYWGLVMFTGVVYVGSLAALLAAKVVRVGWSLFERF